MNKRINVCARHCFDLVLFVGLCFAVYAIHKWSVPHTRGFFCGDESLQYPYRSGTISATVLVSIVLLVPLLVILIIELLHIFDNNNNNNNNKNSGDDKKKKNCGIWWRLSRFYTYYGCYLFGLALTLIATELTKFSVGRLRPHFFAVCQPQLPDGSTCNDTVNHGRYISEYRCVGALNVTEHMLREVSLSFPSGHASLFFYAMLYVVLYMQMAINIRCSKLLKHLLQFACMLAAWYVALTRISDYKHHWTDVLAGMLLGSGYAFIMAYFVAHFHSHKKGISSSPTCRQLRFSMDRRDCDAQQASATLRTTTNNNNNSSCNGMTRQTKLQTISAATATPVLPAYTFGTLPYIPAHHHHHQQQQHHQYATHPQTYHNYGYVP